MFKTLGFGYQNRKNNSPFLQGHVELTKKAIQNGTTSMLMKWQIVVAKISEKETPKISPACHQNNLKHRNRCY